MAWFYAVVPARRVGRLAKILTLRSERSERLEAWPPFETPPSAAPQGGGGDGGGRESIRSRGGADAVAQPSDAGALRAMLAAEEGALLLEPAAENADAALVAGRCQRVNGAFETVVGMGDPAHAQLERLIVIVPAGFTSDHDD